MLSRRRLGCRSRASSLVAQVEGPPRSQALRQSGVGSGRPLRRDDQASPPRAPGDVSDWGLEEVDAEGRAFIAAGWASYLPGTAFDLYSAILQFRVRGEPPTVESIRRCLVDFDPPAAWRLVGGFDAPVEPYHGDDAEGASWDRRRWVEFRAEAGGYGVAVATPNEILVFLCRLGLIERDGTGGWAPVAPVPLLEDVIEVSHEQRQALAGMRPHVLFAPEKRLVRERLAAQRGSAGEPVVTSVAALAESLLLPPMSVRSALALLVEDGVVDGAPIPIADRLGVELEGRDAGWR